MDLNSLINKLKYLSDYFSSIGIYDIYTNSKIYEVLMAQQFNHIPINGHAHTPDARDNFNNFYEYKHYKISSSNHTWTFNDFSETTINKLNEIKSVYFSVINDEKVIPYVSKTYIVSGIEVSRYLLNRTPKIQNSRKMINISEHQIIENMKYEIIYPKVNSNWKELEDVFITAGKIEKLIKVNGILTSNKLWELLVACKLNHNINSDQKNHDAYDSDGYTYEYKVSSTKNWTFQDISQNVLQSYLDDKSIVLAVVNKKDFIISNIILCNPNAIVAILQEKLTQKENNSQETRRLSANIGLNDVRIMLKYGEAQCLL